MSEQRAKYTTKRPKRSRGGTGLEAMHLLVAEARKEAAEGRGVYIPPLVDEHITHKEYQRLAIDALVTCGYRVYYEPDSRLCPSGWPDVFALNPKATPSVIAVEVKVGKDTLRPEQRLWGEDMRGVGVPYVLLRPENWPVFLSVIDDGHIQRGREMLGLSTGHTITALLDEEVS